MCCERGSGEVEYYRKGHEFEIMELLEHQLLEVQRVAGVVQDKLAEAQSVKTLYDRSASSFQYGRLLDCMMEASEHAECLTDWLGDLY